MLPTLHLQQPQRRKEQRACAEEAALELSHVLPCSSPGCIAAAPTHARYAGTAARRRVRAKVRPLSGQNKPGVAARAVPVSVNPAAASPLALLSLAASAADSKTEPRTAAFPQLHAPDRYANEAHIPPSDRWPRPPVGSGSGRGGCFIAGQSERRPCWRHANQPLFYLNERVAPPLLGWPRKVTGGEVQALAGI